MNEIFIIDFFVPSPLETQLYIKNNSYHSDRFPSEVFFIISTLQKLMLKVDYIACVKYYFDLKMQNVNM